QSEFRIRPGSVWSGSQQRFRLFAAMELHRSKNDRQELERGGFLPGLEKYPARHPGCKPQSAPFPVPLSRLGPADPSVEPLFRPDPSLVVSGSGDDRPATITPAIPEIHQR